MQTQLELYQKVMPLAKLGIWERNLLSGEMYWNQVVYEIFEVPPGLQPSVYETLAFYLEPHLVSSMIEDSMNTRLPQQGVLQLMSAKGNLKWVKVNVLASFEGDLNTAICGTIEDITTHQNMYNILQEREERFQQAFDYAPIGMAMLSATCEWVKINESFMNNLEYCFSDLKGQRIQQIVHEDDQDNFTQSLKKLSDGETNAFTLEMRMLNSSGIPVWVMLSQSAVRSTEAEILYFIVHIKDISERRKHTEILLKERRRLDNIIKGTGVGTWEWDIRSDQLLYNRRSAELLGFDKLAISKDHMQEWHQFIHPEDRQRNMDKLGECFDQKSKFYACECRMRHHSGDWVWIEIRGKVIKWSAGGKPMLMLGTFADIHTRKSLEEQQNAALKVISEQNTRLLDFAHIVSHNLRSHTGNIQMLVEAIAEEQDKREVDHMIGMLGTNVGNLQDTLSHLNEIIKIQDKQDINMARINLLDEINKAISTLAKPIKALNANLQVEIPPDLVVDFDPDYMQSVLLNLIGNCLKYRNPNHQLNINISASGNDPMLLKVCDNGLGLDMKMHGHKLFGMYKTFHGNPDARGIGLFLTKNQVEAMGGKIYAESEVSKGSIFTVKLKSADVINPAPLH